MIDSAKISKLGLPVVIPVAEFRDLVGAGHHLDPHRAPTPPTELKKAPRAVPADPGAQRESVECVDIDRLRHASIGPMRARRDEGIAAAVLLAVRGAGAGRRARDHHLPVGLHHLDEPERVEGRLARPPSSGSPTTCGWPSDPRFLEAVWPHPGLHVLAVVLPLISARSRPSSSTRSCRCAASCAASSSCR